MAGHGVYVLEQATSVSAPVVATTAIPFVCGVAPIQSAESPPVPFNAPVLVTSFEDAVSKLGYTDSVDLWRSYSLCEFMYSHFKLYGCQPVIFCNVLDPSTMSTFVAAQDYPVEDHKVKLPFEAMDDSGLVVQPAGGGSNYTKGTDYDVFYQNSALDSCLVVELLPAGAAYSETTLHIEYNTMDPSLVTPAEVVYGLDQVDNCLAVTRVIPDLICAPGFSDNSIVAATMAVKARGVSGLFRAKALVDINTDSLAGAATYSDAIALKVQNNLFDENMIVCWPLLQLDSRNFHMSTHLAGLMAKVDTENGGSPYESPSNKNFQCDALAVKEGAEKLIQSKQEADLLNMAGIVTAINFTSGWVCWGNYTACYPEKTDVKDIFIPISRMFDWVANTCIQTFWAKIDKPMNRRLMDSIVDTCNIWLNGLVGAGYLLGARVEFREEENPLTDLLQGIVKLHIFMTPPAPAQEIDFILEYDADYVLSALGG